MRASAWLLHCYHTHWSHSGCQAAPAASVPVLPLSYLPCFFQYAYLHMPLCMYLQVCLCWARNPLLSYSCVTSYKFKGKNNGVFSLCHNAYVSIWKDFEEHVRECLNCLQQTISRNPDFRDTTSECLKGSKDHVIGKSWKGELCYTMPPKFMALSCLILWKAEHA